VPLPASCNEKEPPDAMPCICRYYFYNEGPNITTVLKDANLVDIDAVKIQISESKSSVVAGLTGNFVWR
jgi:hypothetical protein